MAGSYRAAEIDREYKNKKIFEKKQRSNCKEKQCNNCGYLRICTENERDEHIVK